MNSTAAKCVSGQLDCEQGRERRAGVRGRITVCPGHARTTQLISVGAPCIIFSMATDLTPEITIEIQRVLERFGVDGANLDLNDSAAVNRILEAAVRTSTFSAQSAPGKTRCLMRKFCGI